MSTGAGTPPGAGMIELFRDEFEQISERLENRGVELLESPSSAVVAELFRDLHTLKGNSQAIGLEEMGRIAHALEEILDELQRGGHSADAALARVLLDANDAFRVLVRDSGRVDVEPLLERIGALRSTPSTARVAPPSAPAAAPAGPRAEAISIPVEVERVAALFDAAERLRAALLSTGEPRHAESAEEMTRMLLALGRVPVGRIVPRLRRVVLETAEARERDVELRLEGDETQAEAAVIQDISGVLPHMLRNAIDHGLEPREERQRRGKPEAGTLTLSFGYDGDAFRVVMEDDGRGMDADAIVASAIDRGVITEPEAARLSDDERLRLVFASGVSTREQADEISGRGVGMDAVAAVVDKHRGRFDISTRPGEGTRFELRFPLRLRWEEFLVFEVEGRRLGVPVRQVAGILAAGRGAGFHDLPRARLSDFGGAAGMETDPLVRLQTARGEILLLVDALVGFAGALVQPAPGRSLPEYVSGIAQLPSGDVLWAVDAEAVAHQLDDLRV